MISPRDHRNQKEIFAFFTFWVSFRFRCEIVVGFGRSGSAPASRLFMARNSCGPTRHVNDKFGYGVGSVLGTRHSVGNLERNSFGSAGCLFAASRNAKCSSFTEVSTWRSLGSGSTSAAAAALASASASGLGPFPEPKQATALQQRLSSGRALGSFVLFSKLITIKILMLALRNEILSLPAEFLMKNVRGATTQNKSERQQRKKGQNTSTKGRGKRNGKISRRSAAI